MTEKTPMTRRKIDDMIGQRQERNAIFASEQLGAVDHESRTVMLAFSSEEPVDRWFGREILDHDPMSVDLTRLLTGAPLLLEHDPSRQIGVIESAHLDPDRVGRAKVRFSRSQLGEEIYQDVVDKIRQKVSVGYVVHKYEADPDDENTFRAVAWSPLEISVVSIPADNRVGIGRSLETVKPEPKEVKPMSDDMNNVAAPIDVAAIRAEAAQKARSEELRRVSEINKIASRHGVADMAADFIDGGKSVAEFTSAALEEVASRAVARDSVPATQLGMSRKETQQYSIMNAYRALVTGNWKNAGLEREASISIQDKLGRESRGFFVPWEVQTRAQNTQTMTAGGSLVATDLRPGSFIDLLRANSVVMGLGANMLPGLVGNVDISKQTGASTFYWLGEGEDGTDSELTFGVVSLAPRTVAGAIPITRRMMMQSTPSIDALVINDLSIGAALAMDDAILEGDGVKKPLGIVSVTGVNTQTVSSAGSPTWAELVGFETKVSAANALAGNLAYVTTPTVRGNLKTTAKDSGSGLFLLENGNANGYPVAATSQLTASRIIFGNFSDVLIGMWGVLDIEADKSTLAASGGTVMRAFQDCDSAIRHAESFCINA